MMIMVKQMLPKGKLILEEIARIELFVTEVRRQKLNNDSREWVYSINIPYMEKYDLLRSAHLPVTVEYGSRSAATLTRDECRVMIWLPNIDY